MDYTGNGAPSWSEVKERLGKQYKSRDEGNAVRIIFGTENERSQLVLVTPSEQNGSLYINILSLIGDIATSRLGKALEKMSELLFGSLVRLSGQYFLKISLDMDFTPFEELSDLVGFAAAYADEMEKEFVGGDEH